MGLGYMGLATGLAFAGHGLAVIGYDIDPAIRSSVSRGKIPFHEAGLEPLLKSQLQNGRFRVVDSVRKLCEVAEGIFLCVPTPSQRNGSIDLRPVQRSAEEVGDSLRAAEGRRLVVVKSSVVPGTTESVVAPIVYRRSGRSARQIGVGCNPEFLAEGRMVDDALHPSRIVIGTNDSVSSSWLRRVYRPFRAPIFNLTPAGAELVKYAANTFLALKISYANEVARIADRIGANVDAVMAAVGHDPRIGQQFLAAGPGFGGSCFEKDLKALMKCSSEFGVRLRTGETALIVNAEQLAYSLNLIRAVASPLSGKQVCLLGLSFKAGTDDVRETRALGIARALLDSGAKVRGHDPVSIEPFRRLWLRHYRGDSEAIQLFPTVEKALKDADVAVLQADWPLYRRWSPAWSQLMRRPLVVDLRRALDPRKARVLGLTLVGLGAGNIRGAGAQDSQKVLS